MEERILEVKDLKASFYYQGGKLQVIRGFDLQLNKGEIIGVLGESGSGKTVSSSCIMRLIDEDTISIDSGSIVFDDKDIIKLK